MLIRKGEGSTEYRNIQNGNADILLLHKFTTDDTDGRCGLVAELNFEPGQSTGDHPHAENIEIMYLIQGELACYENDEKSIMHVGDITVTAKGNRHHVVNETSEKAVALALVIK